MKTTILIAAYCALHFSASLLIGQETQPLPLDYDCPANLTAQTIATLQTEANAGNPIARNRLGYLIFHHQLPPPATQPNHSAAALEYFRLAAEQGHPQAQYNLGRIYHTGTENTAADIPLALHWYRKSAAQGCPEAEFILAECAFQGIGTPQNREQAVSIYRELAQKGYPEARRRLADCLNQGTGTEPSPEQAAEWYLKAATAYGCGDITNATPATPYIYPDSPCIDPAWIPGTHQTSAQLAPFKIIECLRQAAQQGNPDAQTALAYAYKHGIGTLKNAHSAQEWEQKSKTERLRRIARDSEAAENGQADAQYRLGQHYQNGTILNNYYGQSAHYWYQKAAEQGHPQAQLALAQLYAFGIDPLNSQKQQHEKQAAYWYRRAAEQGVMQAQIELAHCYAFGWGIEENAALAAHWYARADKQGPLIFKIEQFWNTVIPEESPRSYPAPNDLPSAAEIPRDPEDLPLIRKALNGNIEAQNTLGRYYERPGLRNNKLALAWYRKAAAQGNKQAAAAVLRVQENIKHPRNHY
ncbi:tetratricopeptide repeat protein [Akkermansia glycaniphila]|uniref:Sel1 repeat n=1 Tax=Akkermansia glycaniphila TaxID=1679444 RepID=A0A1C7PCY6_9BACT|nr:tetratricopeptide repeat protein [Akkermansia glycaniphila]OCA03420.1 hypothetical protein AC781_04930 [Akkermansia glycaniphila]SEH90851.1 sel1 repeat [Akkermansia glycaniphila]